MVGEGSFRGRAREMLGLLDEGVAFDKGTSEAEPLKAPRHAAHVKWSRRLRRKVVCQT